MSARRAWLRAAAGVVALTASPVRGRAAAPQGEALAALRAGGCVVLMRHARTDPGVGDPPGFRLEACGTQRNLSAEGRSQAEAIGAALRAAGVPLDAVRSSRWCRCLDTARLAFGRVEPWPPLDSFFDGRASEPVQTAAVRAWALAVAGPGNAVGVTHQVNVTALTGEWLAMGEALVLRPRAGTLEIVGRFGG
jgi:broad specificity phosphatase PhoE